MKPIDPDRTHTGRAPQVSVRLTSDLVAFIGREQKRLAKAMPAGLAAPNTGDVVRAILTRALQAEGGAVKATRTRLAAGSTPTTRSTRTPRATTRSTRTPRATTRSTAAEGSADQDALRREFAALVDGENHKSTKDRRYSVRKIETATGVSRGALQKFRSKGRPLSPDEAKRLTAYLRA